MHKQLTIFTFFMSARKLLTKLVSNCMALAWAYPVAFNIVLIIVLPIKLIIPPR